MSVINGYELIGKLTNSNAGFSKWGFAKKSGVTYFIKEFLAPVYPIDKNSLSETQYERKCKICNEFETKRKKFYHILDSCDTGNVIIAKDFFRHKSKYYLVTEKVNVSSMGVAEISKLNDKQKILIMKVISHCFSMIHSKGIVHGDIKPDNILIKQTQKAFTAKIIDFDAGFFEADGVGTEEFYGDEVYFAPESYLYMAKEVDKVTTKIDVFALGILFCQYFTGEPPIYDKKDCGSTYEAVLRGLKIEFSDEIPQNIKVLLSEMLRSDPNERPTMEEVFDRLLQAERKETSVLQNSVVKEPEASTLKSTMRKSKRSSVQTKNESEDTMNFLDYANKQRRGEKLPDGVHVVLGLEGKFYVAFIADGRMEIHECDENGYSVSRTYGTVNEEKNKDTQKDEKDGFFSAAGDL